MAISCRLIRVIKILHSPSAFPPHHAGRKAVSASWLVPTSITFTSEKPRQFAAPDKIKVQLTKLRGAETVIVGIQPEVAFAMVQLGLTLERIFTALDLDAGLALLRRVLRQRDRRSGRDRGRISH